MEWDLASLANLGEFVGGIGGIVTLVYLAVQVRSNTTAQRNEIEARTLERLGGMQRMFTTDADVSDMYNRGLTDPTALTFGERMRFAWYCTEFFGAMEFLFAQHRRGNVSEDLWQRWDKTFHFWMHFPGMLSFYVAFPIDMIVS